MNLPVVFFPGIMGSRLQFTAANGRYWDPDDSTRMRAWLSSPWRGSPDFMARQLHAIAPAEVMREDSRTPDTHWKDGWAGVVSSYYLSLLLRLKKETDSGVYAVGYDWRQDLLKLTGYVRARLEEIREREQNKPVVVVTHSMGGLLIRAAMKTDRRLEEWVGGVIHVVQPVLGAVVLYRRFYTGYRPGLDSSPDGFRLLQEGPMFWLLGYDPRQFVLRVCGLPGALQLLPSHGYRYPAGQPFTPDPAQAGIHALYGHHAHPPGLIPTGCTTYVRDNLRKHLDLIQKFHVHVDGYSHPHTWAIYGTGLKTDVRLDFEQRQPVPHQDASGDGTVPGPSAAAIFPEELEAPLDAGAELDPGAVRQWRLTGLEHGTACCDERVQAAVVQLVRHVSTLPEPSAAGGT